MIRAAAGMLFTSRDRILLVRNRYKTDWNLPGGILNNGETPRQAATREVKEELGITKKAGRLLAVDNVILPSGELLIAFVFLGGHINTSLIRVDMVEVTAWEWCTRQQVAEKTPTAPKFQSRILHAMDVIQPGGRPKFLEDGQLPNSHGTRACYLRGCRCQPCTKANTAYGRDQQQLAARWKTTNPQGPATISPTKAAQTPSQRNSAATRNR